jgi:uncharacterized protein YdaU (DUF1376 family)
MGNGLPYYKAYPRDFIEGTIGMPFEMKCAYRVVLDLIYMQGGRLPDDARYISGLLGCSVRKWKSVRGFLIAAGKIHASGGVLTNYRAEKELETLAKLQLKQRENRAGSNENKDLQKPWSDHTEPEPEPESTLSTSVDNASGQGLVDFSRAVSDKAVDVLIGFGVSDERARRLVGKWRSEAGDVEAFTAIRDAEREGATDPISWIEKKLKRKPENANKVIADYLAELKNGGNTK